MSYSQDTKGCLKSLYTDNLVDDFYNLLLSQANLYQRVSGYFSGAGVDLYANGIEELAKNGGQMQFIISKEIPRQDYERIQAGYSLKEDLKTLKLAERNDRLSTEAQQRLGNLAFMIANGRARVKVALVTRGIFHDKFGLITSDDEIVFFNGSANETRKGIIENYESISVDVSWDKSANVQTRIKESKERFERLWRNEEPEVTVIEVSELAYEEIAPYVEQATISNIVPIQDDRMQLIDEGTISFRLFDDRIARIDNTPTQITKRDRKLRIGGDLSAFFENDNVTICAGISYKDIERIIRVTIERAKREGIIVTVSPAVEEFIARNKYSIDKYKIMGEVYKRNPNSYPEIKKESFNEFSAIVQQEVNRPLLDFHLQAAYFEYEMMRAANFSVPGAGKTAMLLGVFAFLNREETPKNEKINHILVVSPINAFDSWKREFKAVFGNKKELRVIDAQSKTFKDGLLTDWGISNLILVNYESLGSNVGQLKRVIKDDTILVFDEVHRIKNPDGQRAKYALEISKKAKFRYVLTGTPIPNKYRDIYNFLQILYGAEYNSFFGWDLDELTAPRIQVIEEINKSMYPFFWRTNKVDLNVPSADEDVLCIAKPTEDQLNLAESIYQNETSSLAKLIRLIQASTNPELVNYAINYRELMAYDDDGENESTTSISERDFADLLGGKIVFAKKNQYKNIEAEKIVSPKFEKGIELVSKLVSEGKKVLVWGIFVNTIVKIRNALANKGIYVNLVYGGTQKEERVRLIDEFRDGSVQVLVTNPQTLGESISLHQTVHDAVYFEYDFNLTYMLQSRDRIHRLGLESNQYTRYYYLLTEGENIMSDRAGYIDGKIYDRLKEKEKTMYRAIDGKNLSIEYSVNEIEEAIKIIDEERRRMIENG